jgi:hypothetical protein
MAFNFARGLREDKRNGGRISQLLETMVAEAQPKGRRSMVDEGSLSEAFSTAFDEFATLTAAPRELVSAFVRNEVRLMFPIFGVNCDRPSPRGWGEYNPFSFLMDKDAPLWSPQEIVNRRVEAEIEHVVRKIRLMVEGVQAYGPPTVENIQSAIESCRREIAGLSCYPDVKVPTLEFSIPENLSAETLQSVGARVDGGSQSRRLSKGEWTTVQREASTVPGKALPEAPPKKRNRVMGEDEFQATQSELAKLRNEAATLRQQLDSYRLSQALGNDDWVEQGQGRTS